MADKGDNFMTKLIKSVLNLFDKVASNVGQSVGQTAGFGRNLPTLSSDPPGSVKPVHPRVLLIIYNPTIPSEDGRKLVDVLKWNNPDKLVEDYIADIRDASYGYCNYKIVERIEVDQFPIKADGFAYTGDSFISAWRARGGFHQPDWVDYDRIMQDFNLVERVNKDQIDEVWLFAFPYGGFYESRMTGPDAFWCNAPPLEGYENAKKRFIIMGFNYERQVGQMLEAHGHRCESIIKHVYRRKKGEANLWELFTRYDKTHPGRSEVGIVHYAPNSTTDYDWGNKSLVMSRCDNWLNYPDLSGAPKQVDCMDWGMGDTRLHHMWWFKRFPHIAGVRDGFSNNWWEYVTDPNQVK
jgi:hypothetical protein